MIPSTPRRTWLFLILTSLAYFGPDLLAPATWSGSQAYQLLSAAYQGALVVAGFAFGPAICRALVVQRIASGPLHAALEQAMAALGRRLPVTLAGHAMPFVLTAGLTPRGCQVFVSTALLARLSPVGIRFLLARAVAHTVWRQRMAALLPVLILTVLVPDEPRDPSTWLLLGLFLLLWLVTHWGFELDADRLAARMLGSDAATGLREVQAATASRMGWLTPSLPLNWRLHAIERA